MNNNINSLNITEELKKLNEMINNSTDYNDSNIYEDNNNCCLITGNPLKSNYITLQCNHKFNYEDLYKEICAFKFSRRKYFRCNINDIQCPYCRNIQHKLLPYIPIYKDVNRIVGVNSPSLFCMKHKFCQIMNKNKLCNKDGFESSDGILCTRHWKEIQNNIFVNNLWTDEMQIFFKKHKVKDIKQMLQNYNLPLHGNKKTLIIRLFNR